MAVTAQLGTFESYLGNIVLGMGGGAFPAPPQPPATYATEIRQGPPMRGAPWVRFLLPTGAGTIPPPAPPPPTPAQLAVYAPAITFGPPMRGAPWLARTPTPFIQPPGVIPIIPPMPSPGTRPSKNKLFIERVPEATEKRLRAHTEKTSLILNSLIRKGQIAQLSAAEFTIRGGAFEMTRPPESTDDAAMGVVVGAMWVDTATGTGYMNVDNTIGGAVWKQITT